MNAITRTTLPLDAMDDDTRIDTVTRIETLLATTSHERFSQACMDFTDEEREMSVTHLRHLLQLEDHLDWLLREDFPSLLAWARDNRRKQALAFCSKMARLWQALGTCIGRYALESEKWDPNGEHAAGLLPLTIAIALHCHVNEMRWSARGATPCDMPMRALHRLYEIAESRNIAEQKVFPYEADVDFSVTPQGQYVLMLLMADLAERALPSQQRLVAQHWLSDWSADVVLSATYEKNRFSLEVDLSSSEGLQRLGEVRHENCRYLDIHAVASHIEEVDAFLANSDDDNGVPSDIFEATEEDLAATLAWLEKLYHDRSATFSSAREQRVAERNRFARVIVGWHQVQAFAEASAWESKYSQGQFPAKCPPLDATTPVQEAVLAATGGFPTIDTNVFATGPKRDPDNFTIWRVRDLSTRGFGLSSTFPPDATLAVGTLVLVAIDGSSHWDLGRIVRKFKSLDEHDSRFGIEVIGKNAVPIRLSPRRAGNSHTTTLISLVTGLLLNRPDHADAPDLLLVSGNAIALTKRYEIKNGNERKPIRTTMPTHSAGAWVAIQFEADDGEDPSA